MTTTQTILKRTAKSSRFGLRTTPEQEIVLRRAAELCHKTMTEFILDSAYHAAEEALLNQRLFTVSGIRYEHLLDLLDRPAEDNIGLQNLFSKSAPWDQQCP